MICEAFNDIEVVHIILDLQVHVLHKARVIKKFVELSGLFLERRAVVLPCEDV